MSAEQAKPEFSRPVAVSRIGSNGLSMTVQAEPHEREALAQRLDLMSLDRLEATLAFREKADGVVLEGHLTAELAQRCVVSLQPVPVRIEEDFTQYFSENAPSDAELMQRAMEEGLDFFAEAEDEEIPDPIVNGRIDAGEAVVQQLAMLLDPYPRLPDAELPARRRGVTLNGEDEPLVKANPFAELAGKIQK
ncbi:YceD family protein [Oceanibaculum indicum]|uniref:Uncharacterized metal-binding protein YceD (DUF177 family) n=1 Tax=Oceanibaculum indicum TaxID=526216 RepID=A0A420WQ77_9PROT|nr:YceD family protein [Oceanibaculum indicum]RKQ73211.1 uncharacterized metal-binding protein YceD (DUF177 family) [Oceanibaculum indicum]